MAIIYSKWALHKYTNILHSMYGPLKFIQIGIFCSKIYHLATLSQQVRKSPQNLVWLYLRGSCSQCTYQSWTHSPYEINLLAVWEQGRQIFWCNIPKLRKICQMTTKYSKWSQTMYAKWPQSIPNDHKLSQMTTKYAKWPKPIPNYPNLAVKY
jgi:hypothetical protein